MLGVTDTSVDASVRKDLDVSTSMSMTKSYDDLKLLISCWSVDKHAFIASWGEFTPTLEDVAVMFYISLFADYSARGIILTEEEEERTLQCLMLLLGVRQVNIHLLESIFQRR